MVGQKESQSLLSAVVVEYPRLNGADLGNGSADIIVSHGSEIHLRVITRGEVCRLQTALERPDEICGVWLSFCHFRYLLTHLYSLCIQTLPLPYKINKYLVLRS